MWWLVPISLPGVQQGHIQHHNGRLLLLGDDAPLLQNFLIIAPQTVDALYNKGIAVFQFPERAQIGRTLKILAGLLVHINLLFPDSKGAQGNPLPFPVLFPGGYPDVAIFHNATSNRFG